MWPERRLLALPALILPGVGLALTGACTLAVGDGDLVFVEDGSGSSTGVTSSSSTGGAPPGTVLYVSASLGNDANDGLESDAALSTLARALEIAHAESSPIVEIRVCSGSYTGPVILDVPVSLRGAYDCATWERLPDFELPALAGDTTITAATDVVLEASGAAITNQVRIEGLNLSNVGVGARTIGLRLTNGASPVVSSMYIEPGGGSGIDSGSVGVDIAAGASPILTGNLVRGGSGHSDAGAGSVAVYVRPGAGSPVIWGNRFDAGAGLSESGVGSVAVLVEGGNLTGPSALKDNPLILGGQGVAPTGTGSVGVLVQPGVAVEIIGNRIDGGSGAGQSPEPSSVGILTSASGTVVRKNRIYGGSLPASATSVNIAGVLVYQADNVLIIDNMIHGGNLFGTTAANLSISGILIAESAGTNVLANTVFSGSASGLSGVALSLEGAATKTVVSGNLLFSNQGAEVLLRDCLADATILDTFDHNATFGGVPAFQVQGGTCGSTTYSVMSAFAGAVGNAGGDAPGNVHIASSCTGDTNCSTQPMCTTFNTCAEQVVFASWSETDFGFAQLQTDTAWQLHPSIPCSVAKPDHMFAADLVPDDFFSKPRDAQTSMGAHELNGGCP